MTCHIMKTEVPEDKGRAAEGNRQRFGRLYVNRALNHIRIIVIGSLLKRSQKIHIYFVIYSFKRWRCKITADFNSVSKAVADKNVCNILNRKVGFSLTES